MTPSGSLVPPGQGQREGRFLFRWCWPLGLWEVYGLRMGALGQTPLLGSELEEGHVTPEL